MVKILIQQSVLTFSTLDAGIGSLKLAAGAKPLLHTNIFLIINEMDFFLIALGFPSNTSFTLLISIILVLGERSPLLSLAKLSRFVLHVLSTADLDGKFRNLFNGIFPLPSSMISDPLLPLLDFELDFDLSESNFFSSCFNWLNSSTPKSNTSCEGSIHWK